jgi:1-acyl-sn-glycerol-3-phosphate acyltransferase
MAKRELFEVPVIGWYLWAYGAFPVRRFSGDMGALRVARNYLRDGDIILMFPEGTRSHADGMRPALPGAAMVALISKAPIVPVGITGSNVKVPRVLFQWLWHDRPRITVTFGPAFDLQGLGTDARAAEAGTDRMMRHIAALLPQEYQGAYGPGSEDEIVVVRQRDRRSSEDDAGERASSAEDGD